MGDLALYNGGDIIETAFDGQTELVVRVVHMLPSEVGGPDANEL